MDRHVYSPLAQGLTHTFRITLLAILLGAILAFLEGAFVPVAHAQTAASSVTPATTVTVEIRTIHANSVRVMELPALLCPGVTIPQPIRSRSRYRGGHDMSSLDIPVPTAQERFCARQSSIFPLADS